MKLNKIIVTNFRQFYGSNTIVFSTDEEKNITLIHGENGLGKTTLLNAILWCFYNRFTNDFENPREIVNIFSLSQGNIIATVEIIFNHEGKEFYIKREYNNSTQNNDVIVYELENGTFIKQVKLALPFIQSVIPSQMADYFFFHGEGIANINNNNNLTKFRKAIRDILGFTSAEYAKDDLIELISRRKVEIQKITKKNNEYSAKYKIKTDLEYDRRELISAREVCKDNIENYQIELDALSERLKNIKVYNVSDIQNKKQAEEKRVKHIEAKTSELMAKQKKLIYQYGMILFGYKLANDTMLNITEKEVLGEIPSPYDESLINKIIDAKLCICGREVNPLSCEYEHIKSLRNKANTADIKQKRLAAVHFAGSIGNLSEKPQEFITAYQDIDKEIANLLREKQISTLEIADLQQQLEDIGDGGEREVATINKEIHSISTQKENAKIRMSNIEKNISVLNTRIGECDRWISSNAPDNDLVYKYNRDIEKLEKLVRLCESKLKNYELTARNNIAVSVNVILNNFSRKEFNVRVTENFDFKLARPDGSLVAKSKGENLLLNLSFVSALLGFCAQRASGDNRFLIKGTVAPFFIDAPFGELDDTYRQATAIFLPQCCEQLILLLSSSHWSGTVDSSIKDRVGKEYLIISHKTEKQNEKPSDLIEIKNIVHQQSIYESDFEGSLIKEI